MTGLPHKLTAAVASSEASGVESSCSEVTSTEYSVFQKYVAFFIEERTYIIELYFHTATKLFIVDGIGNEMVFGEMRSNIRHRLLDIRPTIGENLGKNQPGNHPKRESKPRRAQLWIVKARYDADILGHTSPPPPAVYQKNEIGLKRQIETKAEQNIGWQIGEGNEFQQYATQQHRILARQTQIQMYVVRHCRHKIVLTESNINCEFPVHRSLPSKETLRGHSDSSFRGEGYIQCCVGVRLCDMYSNQELVEIHFMYGKADGNAALACRRLYQ
ncbi:hypothetical protein ANN_04276 [Periplaneta americana]|uniref:Uncharacterized protein n=1 Tax=Periplaneta americana TaxID=6978 RepID=A0ABQ8T9Y1_PERAM|nr:hypothetical protein ANN_04276 [Periplaneta americana]